MNRFLIPAILMGVVILAMGCSHGSKHHQTALPDPHQFNAHFGDMDTDGDDMVDWKEFDENFENAEQKVFEAVDLNADGQIDHDEWHAFKEAHGLKHQ